MDYLNAIGLFVVFLVIFAVITHEGREAAASGAEKLSDFSEDLSLGGESPEEDFPEVSDVSHEDVVVHYRERFVSVDEDSPAIPMEEPPVTEKREKPVIRKRQQRHA